jgi:glycine/D-amino acid oxidase-like deaminating enzyme
VVIGAGATGFSTAIAAIEEGASVLVVEANWDMGSHGMLGGANVALLGAA